MLEKINIPYYQTQNGTIFRNLPLSFQVFGKPLGNAPIVLVCHALTGNSSVAGENGWWKNLIAENSCIDLNTYSVLCFDIPGNGYNGFLIKNYEKLSVRDVARWFLIGLEKLAVESVFAGIGGSLGGSILWQMAVLNPTLFKNLIPVATDWKATDWLLAQCRIQKQILENSEKPVHDARIHAMTFYRTPESLKFKFNRKKESESSLFSVESWLFHHGKTLEKRFHLQAYKLMNHLLTTINIESEEEQFTELAGRITASLYLVGIDSDGFFLNSEIEETYAILKSTGLNISYLQIESIHGHDAFLIEYQQLEKLLTPIFKTSITIQKTKNHEYEFIG